MPEGEERVYAPGEVIARSRQEANRVYILLEGTARVVYPVGTAALPSWAVVDIIGAGRLFGLVPALDGEPHVGQLEAVITARVISVSRQAFLHELQDHPEVAGKLLLQLTAYVRNTERWLVATL